MAENFYLETLRDCPRSIPFDTTNKKVNSIETGCVVKWESQQIHRF